MEIQVTTNVTITFRRRQEEAQCFDSVKVLIEHELILTVAAIDDHASNASRTLTIQNLTTPKHQPILGTEGMSSAIVYLPHPLHALV